MTQRIDPVDLVARLIACPSVTPATGAVFDVMGVTNVVAKSHGSSNPYNLVRATLNAFTHLSTPSEIAAKRGKTIEEILG